jgi:hypothetical protein
MAAGVIGMTFGTSGHLFEEVDKSELAASTAAILAWPLQRCSMVAKNPIESLCGIKCIVR